MWCRTWAMMVNVSARFLDDRLDACRCRLRGLLAERRLSLSSVDRRLGWRSGHLSRLLGPGAPELKLGELLAVLEVAGSSAAAFFAALERDRSGSSRTRPDAALDLADLLDRIAAAVRHELVAARARAAVAEATGRWACHDDALG